MAWVAALAVAVGVLIVAGCAGRPVGQATSSPESRATAVATAAVTASATAPASPTAIPPASPTAGPTPSPTASADPMARICAEQRAGRTADGEPVVVCAKLHSERPYIRPPPDEVAVDGSATLYVAAAYSDFTVFVGRDGAMYRVVGAGGTPLSTDELPASLHAPSNRDLYLVYRVIGAVAPFDDKDGEHPPATSSIVIDEIAPAILVNGRAIDGAFLGPWEGTVTERADDATCSITTPCWDDTRLVPLRVTFTTLEPLSNFGELMPDDPPLADGESFQLVGAVDNLTQPVLASDGTCMAPLDALGTANPFRPATVAEVRLFRVPGMHGPGDDQLVLEYPADTEGLGGANGMSPLNVLHPANLLAETDSPAWTSISIRNHGAPNFNEINLHPVLGGGGPCTPG